MKLYTVQEYMKVKNVAESTIYEWKNEKKIIISKIGKINYIWDDMETKVISSANIKGGAGKTTAAVNLAAYSAVTGLKTLLIDMDHQNNIQFYFPQHIIENVKYDIYDLIYNDVNIEDCIINTDIPGLDLIISNEKLTIEAPKLLPEENILNEKLETIKNNYNLIFIDTSPSFDIYNKNSFIAADYIIIPVVLDLFSIKGIEQLWEGLRPYIESGKTNILGIFKNIVDDRYAFTSKLSNFVEENYKDYVFKSEIGTSSSIRYLPLNRQTLFHKKDKTKIQKEYKQLFKEILEKL